MTRQQAAARECFGKKRYSDQGFADSIAKRAFKQRKVRLRSYHCEICQGWHLTKKYAEGGGS